MAPIMRHVSILLFVIATFQVKKFAFVSTASISLSVCGSSILHERETFIMATLWEARGGKLNFRIRSSCQSIMGLIILLCGDIETCPRPVSERRYNHDLEHLTNQRGLTILHQNVRGLFANHVYIYELIQSFKGIDILTLSETQIKSNDTDAWKMLKSLGIFLLVSPGPRVKEAE